MKPTSLLLVGLKPDDRAIAADAANAEFGKSAMAEVTTLAEAIQRTPGDGTEVLLLAEPDAAMLAEAEAAISAAGTPRWAIVVVGGSDTLQASHAVTVPHDEWNAKEAGLALRTAVRLHAVQCENATLRGDLSTVGRRISHDLRAPLSGIYSSCDAINEMGTGPEADRAVFTHAITSSADELVQLIERISFVLKASAEAQEPETALMGEIVFGTLQRLEKVALKKGAVINQPAKWPVVSAHPASLELIWTNLVSNALRYGGEQPIIDLGWSELDGEYRFWVEDHGPGVREDRVNRLFQPFNLLHRLNAARGLGLSLVRRLVELQGGRCGYEPRAGGGARFYFTLPAGNIPAV